MSRRAVAEARRAWRAAVAAREEAEEDLARAEAWAERACGDDQWDAGVAAHTAYARLDEAKDEESKAEVEYRRLLTDGPRSFMARGR